MFITVYVSVWCTDVSFCIFKQTCQAGVKIYQENTDYCYTYSKKKRHKMNPSSQAKGTKSTSFHAQVWTEVDILSLACENDCVWNKMDLVPLAYKDGCVWTKRT